MLALGWYLYSNTVANLAARNIATGFAFLWRESGFEIGESPLLSYSAADTYFRALLVGLINTFRVALVGVVCATLLGLAVGLSSLAPNPLLRALSRAYVEFFRNTPLLVQLFFWYALITEILPSPRDALHFSNVFFSNRGIFFPLPGSVPVLEGFNFTGGGQLSPELAALLAGLVVYTAAFIAEIVRAGILAVPRGQADAAQAVGLQRRQALRYVVLPQALRVIVPPLTSQYLNLVKNSSLAVAIGYPDFVSVVNTTINQ
ncbi:MAG TPA: ABC transporter permease subunit, partial [Burkholderiales bacterium]|nr:ABC transporter permease subunit [Burkholderiales bacterium]